MDCNLVVIGQSLVFFQQLQDVGKMNSIPDHYIYGRKLGENRSEYGRQETKKRMRE